MKWESQEIPVATQLSVVPRPSCFQILSYHKAMNFRIAELLPGSRDPSIGRRLHSDRRRHVHIEIIQVP